MREVCCCEVTLPCGLERPGRPDAPGRLRGSRGPSGRLWTRGFRPRARGTLTPGGRRQGTRWSRSSWRAAPGSSGRISSGSCSPARTHASWSSIASPMRATSRAWPTCGSTPGSRSSRATSRIARPWRPFSRSTARMRSSTWPRRPTSTARSTARGHSSRRTWWGRSSSWTRRASTSRRSSPRAGPASGSCTSPPTRCTAPLAQRGGSPRRARTPRTRRTPPRRRGPITSCGRITRPTASRRSSPTARTTTDPSSIRRS